MKNLLFVFAFMLIGGFVFGQNKGTSCSCGSSSDPNGGITIACDGDCSCKSTNGICSCKCHATAKPKKISIANLGSSGTQEFEPCGIISNSFLNNNAIKSEVIAPNGNTAAMNKYLERKRILLESI